MASYEGYCVKCREKREFEGQEVEMANGRRAAQGTCPVCGTKMNRMLGNKKGSASRSAFAADEDLAEVPVEAEGAVTHPVHRRGQARALEDHVREVATP